MKSKLFTMGAFFAILMFLTLKMSWAHDPTPRYRANESHRYGGGNKGEELTHKGFIHHSGEQRRFERARRQAWADGKLTYREMRRLHQLEKKARSDIDRWKHHRVPRRAVKQGHLRYSHKRPAFPMFSIHLSFSKPGSHVAGSFGFR